LIERIETTETTEMIETTTETTTEMKEKIFQRKMKIIRMKTKKQQQQLRLKREIGTQEIHKEEILLNKTNLHETRIFKIEKVLILILKISFNSPRYLEQTLNRSLSHNLGFLNTTTTNSYQIYDDALKHPDLMILPTLGLLL